MYKWEYVKGQRAPKAVLTTDKTDGASPLTVNFSSAGSLDEDPGDSIRYEWDFGDGSPISTEPNPTHTYTQRGRFTAVLSVIDSQGERTSTSTIITSGNTAPTITIEAPLDGGLFSFGDELEFKVTVTDPEDPTVDCKDVTVKYVLGHDTHGHELQSVSGCRGFLQTGADEASHGGNVFAVISAEYVDKGSAGGVPALSTTTQVQTRQKRQEVEHVVTQSGTHRPATNTDGGARRAPQQPRQQRLDQVERSVQPAPDRRASTVRYADNAAGRTVGSPLGGDRGPDGLADGPDRDHAEPDVDGATRRHGASLTFPISLQGKNDLFLVFRQVTGGVDRREPVPAQLGGVQGQRRDGAEDDGGWQRRRHRARDVVAVARDARHVRGVHAGCRQDVRGEHHGQRHLDGR